MQVKWHKFPEEKPFESGIYWVIIAISRSVVLVGYLVGMADFNPNTDQWIDADDLVRGVIGWAEFEYPEAPALKVKFRTNGLPKSVEWPEGTP